MPAVPPQRIATDIKLQPESSLNRCFWVFRLSSATKKDVPGRYSVNTLQANLDGERWAIRFCCFCLLSSSRTGHVCSLMQHGDAHLPSHARPCTTPFTLQARGGLVLACTASSAPRMAQPLSRSHPLLILPSQTALPVD